ncbi:MAG: hypothetical protein QNJ37_08060 [Crocosphaera sp.]|nr:hypothetical protein [Crocosphaera sp.]
MLAIAMLAIARTTTPRTVYSNPSVMGWAMPIAPTLSPQKGSESTFSLC